MDAYYGDPKPHSADVHAFKCTMYDIGTKGDEIKAIELLKAKFLCWWVHGHDDEKLPSSGEYGDDLIPPRYEGSAYKASNRVIVYVKPTWCRVKEDSA